MPFSTGYHTFKLAILTQIVLYLRWWRFLRIVLIVSFQQKNNSCNLIRSVWGIVCHLCLIWCMLSVNFHSVEAHLVGSTFCSNYCSKRIMYLVLNLLNTCVKYQWLWWLIQSEFVEWKAFPPKKAIKSELVNPHLYKLFGNIRYVHYKPHCAVIVVCSVHE